MSIPVIDIFAGPGGLGEGLARYRSRQGSSGFRVVLSVEKDTFAHATLLLRSFYRKLEPRARDAYWAHLRGTLTREELFAKFPLRADAAREECVLMELGAATTGATRRLVRERLGGSDHWLLVGGPPCQAYSLVGRSRNRGNPHYSAAKDHRQTLYIEYLQLLADHRPSVFVMENVKGLLSATLESHRLFDRIREDLSNPAAALRREGRKGTGAPRYKIVSLADSSTTLFGDEPQDYVVKAELYGIPQKRHRVILLGLREDALLAAPRKLLVAANTSSVRDTISTLPKLRSGITDLQDSAAAWRSAISAIADRPWLRDLPRDVRACIKDNAAEACARRRTRGAECIERFNGDNGAQVILNHKTRGHMSPDLERYLFASAFAQVTRRSPLLSDFPDALLPSHANARRALPGNLFSDRFRVQLKDRPASTVTSHISKDGHYYIHYDPAQCRSLTVREAARLQTFPDDYFFCGPRTAQYQQVGNAVPPALADKIGEIVYDVMR